MVCQVVMRALILKTFDHFCTALHGIEQTNLTSSLVPHKRITSFRYSTYVASTHSFLCLLILSLRLFARQKRANLQTFLQE